MGKTYVIYNPLSNNKRGMELAQTVKDVITDDEFEFLNILNIKNLKSFINETGDDDRVIIAGGDGTLNYFLNYYDEFKKNVYFYPCGNGNDFARDIGKLNELILLNEHINKIPYCIVNGETRKYINGVGIGIDGFVCAKVNEKRFEKEDASYIKIALKAIFGDYKKTNATVWIDDKKYEFNNLWFLAAMKGRYCGGGFMMTPNQDRMSDNGEISLLAVHNASLPKILLAFMLVFKGKHTILKKSVSILKGNNIKIEFDAPSYMQLDGESYTDISKLEIETEKEIIKV